MNSISANSDNLEHMKQAFQKLNLSLRGQNPYNIQLVQITDYKVDEEKKQLNILVKYRYMGSDREFEKWMLSEQVLEINPILLTELLISKTKFGSGTINQDEEVMKSYTHEINK